MNWIKIIASDPSLRPPKKWWDSHIKNIEKEKGAKDASAILGKIWSDLPESKKKSIRESEGKHYGEPKKASTYLQYSDPVKLIQEGYPVDVGSFGVITQINTDGDVVVDFNGKSIVVTPEHLQKI